ncbi:unnamed protein product [Litomosoides sigmodontis]|uniref:Uncharacterized protein n=1 Tax=Litomosoides sigmodontis TaxID=42156 RepID=A0A3P6U3Y6_LITSI|nr:unnamed protein product [Litomosoides sigmodontis]
MVNSGITKNVIKARSFSALTKKLQKYTEYARSFDCQSHYGHHPEGYIPVLTMLSGDGFQDKLIDEIDRMNEFITCIVKCCARARARCA